MLVWVTKLYQHGKQREGKLPRMLGNLRLTIRRGLEDSKPSRIVYLMSVYEPNQSRDHMYRANVYDIEDGIMYISGYECGQRGVDPPEVPQVWSCEIVADSNAKEVVG